MKKIPVLTAIVLAATISAGCEGRKTKPAPTHEEFLEKTDTVPVVSWMDKSPLEGYMQDVDRDGHIDVITNGFQACWAVPDLKTRIRAGKYKRIVEVNSNTKTINPELQKALDKAYTAAVEAGYALTREAYIQKK